MESQLPERSGELTAKIVNPILAATVLVYRMVLGVEVKRVDLKAAEPTSVWQPCTAVIDLDGAAKGTVCLNLPRRTAFMLVARMFGRDADKNDPNIRDCVGELVNMIAGNAKAELEQYHLTLGLPRVVLGSAREITFPPRSQPLQSDFSSAIGTFSVIFSLQRTRLSPNQFGRAELAAAKG